MLMDKIEKPKAYITYFLKEDREIVNCPYNASKECSCMHFLYETTGVRKCMFDAIDVRERDVGRES